MVEIKQQLVSSRARTYSGKNPCNFITIHETGNYDKGTGAQTHANLQSRGFTASWHYQVDDKDIIQSYPDTTQCWHAGDGRGTGNLQSIGIEICVNPDSDFKKAVANAADLVKFLMAKHNISIDNVVQHNKWSGKNCPRFIRSGDKGINWIQFISLVTSVEKQPEKPSQTTVKEQAKQPAQNVKDPYNGHSIVDYLNSLGIDSGASNRRKLATQYGVKNYVLSAAKNLELLTKMRDGKVVNKPVDKPVQPKNTVHLPASAKTWRTYKTNVQPVKKNSDWSLTPAAFEGLTYEILGRPYKDVVTIMTSRGKRNIYVGSDTSAVIKY